MATAVGGHDDKRRVYEMLREAKPRAVPVTDLWAAQCGAVHAHVAALREEGHKITQTRMDATRGPLKDVFAFRLDFDAGRATE